MDVIQTTTHFFEEREQHGAVLQRLRTTQERMKPRKPDEAKKLLLHLRGLANALRLDWIKSRLRWMADPEAMNRLRANFEVEKTLGRKSPELWTEQSDAQRTTRMDLVRPDYDEAKPRVVNKYNKESMEMWRHQIDPMLAEEKIAFLPPGKDEKKTQEVVMLRGDSARSGRGRLRMLEQRRSDEDMVLVAENVIEQISLVTRGEETLLIPAGDDQSHDFAAHENLPAVIEKS